MQCPRLDELPAPPPGKRGWPWTEESQQWTAVRQDGSPWPTISVITPSYNKGPFIEETIRSVLLQGYPDVEYLFLDGGSTDQTIAILHKYTTWFSYWVSEPDRGQSHAFNKGLSKATGSIVFWLNADDICYPNAFHIGAQAFQHPSRPRLVIGAHHRINEASEVIDVEYPNFTSWAEYALRRCIIRQDATFFDRELFRELGGLDETLHYTMDRDLFLRVTRHYPPLLLDQVVSAFREYSGRKIYGGLLRGLLETDTLAIKHLQGTRWRDEYIREYLRKRLQDYRLTLREKLVIFVRLIRYKPSVIFHQGITALLVLQMKERIMHRLGNHQRGS
ncbi:glycosyltransferase [candidate division KSB3 bacterium]|uniref:Glycosyltransferase n=1 Tax=candidate division KSB3 bacterium TaxID=2044937 RepID=A0A9D5JTP3_9BACT|nr:glycosyltransferase [candidate division KSB3 bacterium]MBD3324023.1 glycosyltransferase [candidate division KSB3 bacterium]